MFESYGLGSLAPVILGYAISGYDGDTIEVLLRQTPEFKKRFAANEKRVAMGKNALSIAEYLQAEDDYREVAARYGIPAGYVTNDDITDWLANDISAREVEERVQMASSFVNSTDPYARNALKHYYNLSDGDLIAYFLDEKKARPLLERQAAAAQVGGAALRQGLSVSSERAEQFASMGAAQRAESAYSTIADFLPSAKKLGSIYGDDYKQADAEDELLGGLASARRKREKLAEKETASFSGNGGITRTSLRKRNRQAGAY